MKLYSLFLIIVFFLNSTTSSANSEKIEFKRKVDISNTKELKIKFLGNTSIYIEDLKKNKSIFIDAFISRPTWSQLFFRRISHQDKDKINKILKAAKINTKNTDPKSEIIPTTIIPLHSHFDHLLDAPYISSIITGSQLVASCTSRFISESMGFKPDIIDQTLDGEVKHCKNDKDNKKNKKIRTNDVFTLSLEKSVHSDTSIGGLIAPLGKPPYQKNLKDTFKKPQKARKYVEGQSINVSIDHISTNTKIYVLGGIPEKYCNNKELTKKLQDATLVFIAVPVIRELKRLKKSKCKAGKGTEAFWKKLAISSKDIIPVHWDSLGTKLDPKACDNNINKCLKPFFFTKDTMTEMNQEIKLEEKYPNLKLHWLTAFGEINI